MKYLLTFSTLLMLCGAGCSNNPDNAGPVGNGAAGQSGAVDPAVPDASTIPAAKLGGARGAADIVGDRQTATTSTSQDELAGARQADSGQKAFVEFNRVLFNRIRRRLEQEQNGDATRDPVSNNSNEAKASPK